MADHTCPADLTRQIPAEKYLCNIDADRAPWALMVACGQAFDVGTLLDQTLALKAVVDWLLANPVTT